MNWQKTHGNRVSYIDVCFIYCTDLYGVHEKQTKSVYMIKGGVNLPRPNTSSPTKHSFIMIQTFYV